MKVHALLAVVLWLCSPLVAAQDRGADDENPGPNSSFRSDEDGQFDVSDFLDSKYGFLPVVVPITEPAIGYGAAGGLVFISKSLGQAQSGYERPNITFVGGLGTENGTWGGMAGDLRQWRGGRVQTLVGAIYASVNLDFYGIGQNASLELDPLRYSLEPKGGMVQAKYRLGNSRLWAGASFTYATTGVRFDAPDGTPGLPDFESESKIGGITPSLTFDTRNNIFTPTRGSYLDMTVDVYSEALGSDEDFQRAQLVAMHFMELRSRLFLGLRGQTGASFGDTPFYLRPFVYMRGVPLMRYQGEQMAQLEGELRWQLWKRFSLVGFAGGGVAWNDFERLDDKQSVFAGGAGFRYELARKYGLHVGADVGFGPEETAIYIQVGSAWARP